MSEQLTDAAMHWAERGGFVAAFFILAWWVMKRVDRSDERNVNRVQTLETKVDTLEAYIRSELAELVTNCTQALNRVHTFFNGEEK